MKLFTHAGDYN